ncbi:MAG: OmpA family protein [Candidatus Muiribacteriota bacterium]
MFKKFIFLFLIFAFLNTYSKNSDKVALPVGIIAGSDYYYSETNDFADYSIPLKPIESGDFGKIKNIQGNIVRALYTHKEESSYSIFKTYLNEFEKEGYKILFKVDGNEGGSGFNKRVYDLNPVETDRNMLRSGPFKGGSNSNQNYIAAVKKLADREIYITLNVNTGWFKYPIYRIDVIETEVEMPVIKSVEDIKLLMETDGRVPAYDIEFEEESSILKESSYETLAIIAEYILNSTEMNFLIVGHTNHIKDIDSNYALSKERAEAVIEYLQTNFKITQTMTGYGVGVFCPIFSNNTANGRRFNERIEIVVNRK